MWITPTIADVQRRFLPDELDVIQRLQGANDTLTALVTSVTAEVRGAIRAGGYPLDSDTGTIPDELLNSFCSLVLFYFVNVLPQGQQFYNDARKAATERARTQMDLIVRQQYQPEPPAAAQNPRTGQWNSEQKLIGRAHPAPPPAAQYPVSTGSTPDAYANPSAPADTDGMGDAQPVDQPVGPADAGTVTISAATTRPLFSNTNFDQITANVIAQAGAGGYTAAFSLTGGQIIGALAFVNVEIATSANPTINITDAGGTVLQTLRHPNPASGQTAYWAGVFEYRTDGAWHKMQGGWQ